MNTQTAIVSLLLAPFLSAGLVAQDLGLKTAASPFRMVAAVDGAAKDSAVVLVLGVRQAPTKLPDGQVLGISADLLAGVAIADGRNATNMMIRLSNLPWNFTFYAQAVSIDLTKPLDRQTFGMSSVETVVVRKP